MIEIEATAIEVERSRGTLLVTGIMEEEEFGGRARTVRRRSQARCSVENVLTVLRTRFQLRPEDYDIHINFPGGGIPVDGPSAGVGMVTAIASAITGRPVSNTVAMTGEVTIRGGGIKAVGGAVPKIRAAQEAGIGKVLLPADNWQELFASLEGVEVIPVSRVGDVLEQALVGETQPMPAAISSPTQSTLLGAASNVLR